MNNTAPVPYPVAELMSERWSPRAFSSQVPDARTICTLLEAARWAPSCFNEQPWRLVVGHVTQTPQTYAALQSLLMEGNSWAREVPVLILAVAKRHFTHNGNPNRHYMYDTGSAMMSIALEAVHLGLVTHQMGGFYEDRTYDLLGIPKAFYESAAMMALGYPGDPNQLSPELKSRELAPRTRKPVQEIAFGTAWETPYPYCFS